MLFSLVLYTALGTRVLQDNLPYEDCLVRADLIGSQAECIAEYEPIIVIPIGPRYHHHHGHHRHGYRR